MHRNIYIMRSINRYTPTTQAHEAISSVYGCTGLANQ